MNFDVKQHTIFRTLTGSRVYGTANEESDYDYRGVCIPPINYWLGYASRFDQYAPSDIDEVVYGLSKFLHLAAQNNPNIIELLWVPEKYWTTSSTYWTRLVEHRDWFLSKKCFHTYKGYSHSQMRRMKSHREWLMKGELKEPTREDFGLRDRNEISTETINAAQELIRRHLNKYPIEEELSGIPKEAAMGVRHMLHSFLEHTLSLTIQEVEDKSWLAAGRAIGLEDNFLEMLQKEKLYQKARKEYKSWLHWKAERNPRRRESEERYGFDLKHATHLARLLLNCKEILTEKTIHVECVEAESILLPIKRGEWSYEQLMRWEGEISVELEELYQSSDLQNAPQRNKIEDLGVQIVAGYLGLY